MRAVRKQRDRVRFSWVPLLALCLALLSAVQSAEAGRDWYVRASDGRGRDGTIEKPARDLGHIISDLQAGDRIFIAGGTYEGRGGSGADEITVPVEIYGGWDPEFKRRDPWGEHATVFTGDNSSRNWTSENRLKIDVSRFGKLEPTRVVVDGIIFDNAARNRYSADGAKIERKASANENPTPESGGLRISAWRESEIIVRNCIVLNTAPTQGAFSMWGHEGAKFIIENNCAVNNTGNGFALHSMWHPRDRKGLPTFRLERNTALFTEKYDAYGTIGGSALRLEDDTVVTLVRNVLAFNDAYAIDNASQCRQLTLEGNRFGTSLQGDYLEFATAIDAEYIEDEAEHTLGAEDNESVDVQARSPAEWTARYLARTVIDRNAVESGADAPDTPSNRIRSLLGANLQGEDVTVDSDCWLPRLEVEAALDIARSGLGLENRGCANPGAPVDPR